MLQTNQFGPGRYFAKIARPGFTPAESVRFVSACRHDNIMCLNTTATIRLKNAAASATANRITFVIGLSEDAITARNDITTLNTNSNIQRQIFIGLNSTSAYAGFNSSTGYHRCVGLKPTVAGCDE